MPTPIYMKVIDSKGNEIRGEFEKMKRKGSIEIDAFDHEIMSPRDIASGAATGKRQHKPIKITKEIDKASPLLLKVLCTNEHLTEVVFFFWRPDPSGTGEEEQYYTIKLTKATISSMRTFFPHTRIKENDVLKHMEEVSFIYQKIEWTITAGGITGEDDWMTPK
jgi:type VI secretion system secreted protein Hcp